MESWHPRRVSRRSPFSPLLSGSQGAGCVLRNVALELNSKGFSKPFNPKHRG